MLKNKIIVKKIRNIFILLMAIIIMLGAYQNIRNSKAENVIQIEMEVSDKSNILSAQTITVDATETSDGNYLLTLPTSVNKNIVTKYYTSSGEEILVDADNNISTIQLTEEEVTNKKVQVQSDYDTKEVTVNNQTKLLYNKELQELPNESGTGSQDVIVTGYMPLDVDIEVKEMDLATLTSVKLPSENQTMQKAYEISIFEVVEKQGTETNTTNEVQTQTMENGEQNTDSTQQDVATQADVEPQSEVAEQATTQTENTETERVEYDSSVYGEKITVKTKQEQTNAIKTYTLAGDNQVTEVANVTSGEYVDFESDKGDKTLKYIIATQENEAEENISLMSEDTNSDIAVYASSSSSTLKSASSETSATSAFLGSPNITRQQIESVTFDSNTTGATRVGAEKGLIRSFDGKNNAGTVATSSHDGSTTTWKDLAVNKNGVIAGGTWGTDYLKLNGTSSQWVNLGRMEMFLKNEVTLDAIVTFDSTAKNYSIIGNVDDGGVEIALDKGRPNLSIWFEDDANGYTRVQAKNAITSTTDKIRITGTYDGTNMCLYVNGELVELGFLQVDGTEVATTAGQLSTYSVPGKKIKAPINNTVMAIGCNPIRSTAQGNYLSGKVYSAKIYNVGLKQEQIGTVSNWNSSEQGVFSHLIGGFDGFYNTKGEGHKRNAINWYDLTGNQDGILMNGTAAHTVSTANQRWGTNYLEFNGSTDWVNLGQMDLTITNKVTFDSIISLDAKGTYTIIGNHESGGATIGINNGRPRVSMYFEGDSGYTTLQAKVALEPNQIARVTGVYDGTNLSLYVDGELVELGYKMVAGKDVSKNIAAGDKTTLAVSGKKIKDTTNNTVMAIGCNPSGSNAGKSYLDGKVYYAKIFNAGLTQQRIKQIWDVSTQGDYSILAWYGDNSVPYQVHVGSCNEIYANSNSSYLFSNIGSGDKCTATSVIDGLGTLNTSNVTNMNYMFQNCGSKSMTKLFLGPSFDTSSVTSMTGMFQNCGSTSMTQLDLGPAFKKIASSNTNFVANCGKSGAVIYVPSEIFQDIKHFKLSQNSGTTVGYTNGTISPRTTLKSTSSETNATSGFLGNTSIQRQNVQSVKFSSNTSGAAKVSSSKGLVRSFDGYKNTGAGDENAHSTSTTTWKNLSGTSNGAVNGGATWGQNYLSLDGVNDWVDLGQISLTNQVTLDTIVEINSASSEKQAILGNPQNGGVLLQIFEQKVYFWAWINGQSYYTIINSDTELTLGKPTRITGTFNGSKMCLYINGKLEASKSVSGTIVAPEESTPMAIGSNRKGTGTSGNGEFAKANIYSAKVYTQALTQAEIKQIWDVSELGDYSIMAWYDASSSPYTVNIASSFDMYANANSSYLFSYIGYGSSCTATNVIDKMNLLNTQCVTNMRGMFQYCGYRKMTSFSLGNKFDTTNVTDMAYMFYNCGTTAMTSLDLGPAFTAIASSYADFATNCGKSGSITIYSGSAIYSNSNAFRLGANSSVTIGFSRGTINPKYRPEWSIQSYSVSGSSLVVTLQGNVNTANYTGDSLKTVTNRFTNGSTNLVRVNVDGDSSANSTITKTISNASSTTAQTVTCTLTLGNFAESARQSGKNFLEWSGNVLLDYIPTTIEDAYGNPNIAESDGTTMFTDTIKPEFTYEYTNTTIDHGTKTVTIVFDVADKYFSSSALSTDSSASNIDVVVGGVTATNATKTLTKIEDLSTTINGTSKKTGERYRLVITNLDQGEGNDYSGIMTLAFPAGIVTDTSSNGNVAKTITVGIDDPTNGDGHDSGIIVDVVDPVWKIENINIDKTGKKVTADLIATDKYLTGVENSTLTTSGITVSVDGDTNANTVITKSLTEPTFFSNAITGMKEIKYTLTLTNFEEATRQTGKSFLEYSGAVKITVAAGTITDVPSETGGSTSQTQSNSSKEQEFQLGQVDFLKPRFIYEYANTTINHETKTVTVVFDATDKYFNSSALSTDTTASNITVIVDGTTATNATKTLTKLQDITETVNGTSKKVGEKYQLVISNLDQGDGGSYSGVMTLVFPENIVTDTEANGNLAKTITIGIDDPTTGDGHDTGIIVDVVDPIWKVENINIDKTNKKVTADLIATDKYLTGVENSTLTTSDITVSVDGDANANTVIAKSLSTPTFSTNETTGLKEIKYALTLNNFEEATKQTGKSFLEYSGTVKITVAAGTITDDTSGEGGGNGVRPSVMFDANGTNTDGLHIGDFVNYDAGTWTQEELNAIQTGLKTNLQTANGSTSLPSSGFQFGGFAAGTSRNGNATPWNSSYDYIKDETGNAVTGWRVFDIEGDNVTLISAGNPEDYYHYYSYSYNGETKKDGAYVSEYILTGNVNTSWSGADTSGYQKRNWGNYVNVVQKAISATVLTKSELDRWYSKYTDAGSSANTYTDAIFRKIYSEPYIKYQNIIDNYSNYWLSSARLSQYVWYLYSGGRYVSNNDNAALGVRVLVSLSSDVLFNSQKTGTKTLTGGNMATYGGNQTYNCWAIAEGSSSGTTDGQSNTSKEQEFELGHVDFIKPRIEKQSATKDETAKTETIILNVMDKYLDTTDALENSEITVYIDGENVTGLTKTLSKNTRTTATTSGGVTYETNGDITAIVNGTSQIVGQQYKLVLSDFEQATNNSKKYKDWSGTVSIDVAEGAVKDQISASTANTSDAVTVKGDFVDFIAPYLTYQYLTTDIDREGTDADGKSFQMAFEVTDKYYESGKLSIDDLSIQMADGKHTYDLKNTPVTITLNSDEAITAPNVKMTNKTTGEVETVTSTTIGHRYVLTISNLEQLEIAEGNTTLDYSGIVTVSVDANKISDRSGNKNIAKTITSGVSIPDETGDGVVVDVVKPIWRRTTGGSLDLTTKTASLVVKGTDTYYASNSLTAGKIKVYAYTGTTPTDITSLVSPALSTATRLDESVTVDGVTSTRQYGVQYTITLTGIPIDKDQVKVVIPAGTLTDQSGNTNEEYETRLFTTLQSAAGETAATSAFLGNSSIQRQNIESVTFVSGIEGAANNKWDVSAAQDGSIWAWYTGSGPYQVYIGSDEFMCANQDSRYLFSYIGYASNSTATNVINGLEYLNIITATNMSYMFNYCGYQKMTSLNLGNNFDTTNVTNMAGMFQNCGQTKMTSINLGTQFYTSKVTDMSNMFNGCGQTELITFSLGSNFDTTKVTNMSGMFQNFAHKLGILNLGTQFYTSEVTDMSNMFNGCGQNAMTTLTLGTNFDTTKVTNMSQMFKDFAKSSTGMTSLDLGDSFYTTSVTDMTRMFNGCGQTAMVALDLGPAFTKIASANTDFATNCGASGIVIYAPESIYSNRTSFKLNKTGQ